MANPHEPTNFVAEGNVLMPQNVVIRTAAFFAATMFIAQIVLVAYYAMNGEPASSQQQTLVAILTSVVALPIICHSALSAERSRATIAHLRSLAQTDALTGVLNRTGFNAALERLEATLSPMRSAGAMLYLDADHFKSINDRFGHHVGDRVLSLIGDVLRRHTRESDICGRLGGEEFAVLLQLATIDQALLVSERIRTAVTAGAATLGEPDLRLTISIGLAVHRTDETLSQCLRAADVRLYEAKRAGRNRIEHGLKLVRNS